MGGDDPGSGWAGADQHPYEEHDPAHRAHKQEAGGFCSRVEVEVYAWLLRGGGVVLVVVVNVFRGGCAGGRAHVCRLRCRGRGRCCWREGDAQAGVLMWLCHKGCSMSVGRQLVPAQHHIAKHNAVHYASPTIVVGVDICAGC